ncbi:MAG: hypothetical protein CTY25_10905 [Methylobacterium sp.]|nr:MAG: hypothetical protein CTY25_10905 [Methylobacterium sp.]
MTPEAASARLAALLAEPGAMAILPAFAAAGEEARIIGGAVRNALIGADIADLDLATTALPQRTIEIAEERGWKAVPTGIEHGTITIVIAGKPYEVTTLREDIATDGRHAEVRFGRDFRGDAARRDFTINAMSMGLDGVLHDYFGGLADLAARRVRFIGDPDARIQEDYLRALRFLRFSATYSDVGLDEAGLAAVVRNRDGLARLSRERVRQEFLKLLMAESALPVIEEAETKGLLSEMLGFPLDVHAFALALGFARNAAVELDAMARLAALAASHTGDSAETWHARLRLSNVEIRTLHRFAQAVHGTESEPRLLRYRFGEDAVAALVLRAAMVIDLIEELDDRLAEARRPAPEFRLSGEDVLLAGVSPGPRVGHLLAETERRWIASGFPDARGDQQAILKAVLAST